MTKSWICNVECMGVLEHTVIVCSDDKAYWSLKNWKPSLHVLLHRYGTTEAMTWGTDSYFDFLLYRAKSVESILQDNHSVFLVESDAVWLKNPTVLFNQYLNNDLILVANEHMEDESQRQALPALAYLNATSKTRRLWDKLVEICARKEEMYKRGISKILGGSDMGTLNYLIRREPVKVQWLPNDKFVGGKWYGGAEYNEEIAKSIIVIHNNFIQGNDRKEERAKRWGHWFLSDDGTQCVGTPCSFIPNTWPQP
ncbi:uncharacterized protein [Ptychodera flava]|uniref:uncharacterized protein n=1 Tax=Ptychodera flava TaxID=63121 RepID=UPI003969E6D6